ncbi:hypothetical protein CPPG_00073 [Cyanophage P-RSM1]|uniref:Peptidase M23 domain-containing protein n=1 Tax=Cyanophage P-RSM1 TaxID=536444 RepID=M4QQL7_9CAUD|nr:endolysin [Cyanophage P-RSM1]AGH26390.1 hypothetical protein CPPG_00073 [Cyanophage P-RSM1]
MAKAAVQKGSKINVYKVVSIKEPDARMKKKDPNDYETAKGLNKTTVAINNLGATINGMNAMVADLKQVSLDRLEAANKDKPKMDPKYGTTKKGAGGILGSIAKGFVKTGGSFLGGLLKLLGGMFKLFVVLPILNWLSKEENQQKVAGALEVMAKIGKFIWEWAKFGITNTIDGLYKLLSDDSSWMDRIVGFGQAFLGFASIFIGMKGIAWLLNPIKVVKGITTAIRALIKFATNRGLSSVTGRRGRKGRGFAAGGALATTMTVAPMVMMPQMAKGGWISGPMSGYPVSLDGGRSTSFIGHGTEYVSRKAGGQAFVTPYDTPATRRNPGLTAMRQSEAKRKGFAEGGEVKESLNLTEDQFRNLAFGVSGEAQRGTDDEFGVAAAILNRVADPRYPNSIMQVLSAPDQYEAYHKGKMKFDDQLQDRLSSQKGQEGIIAALRELKGRTDFKGTAMYKYMGADDIKFSRKGNFYHYPEQKAKSDPPPDTIPTHYLRFIQNQEASDDQQRGESNDRAAVGVMGKLSSALSGVTNVLSNIFLGGPASAAENPGVVDPPPKKLESEANNKEGANASAGIESGSLGEKVFPLPKGRFQATARQVFGASRGGRSHAGVDLTEAPPWGSDPKIPVVAAIAGSVLAERYKAGQTYYSGMMIRGQDGHDQRYLHMEPAVKPGQEVNAGDQIGRLYDDGDNSHLHFEVYKNGKGGPLNPSLIYPSMFKAGTAGGGQMTNPTAFQSTSSVTSPGQNKPPQAAIQSMGDMSREEDTTFSGQDGIISQFSAEKTRATELQKATDDRDKERENFKAGVENAVMQASQQVQRSNQQSAAAIQQSQQGVQQAAQSGGGGKDVITGGLPGIGNVNINGVMKTTAYALNSNNNFMRGILR